jgi:hypothetical protein
MLSCTALNKNLDGPAGRRTQEHTERLFEGLDHKQLWDGYGIIDDVLVRSFPTPTSQTYRQLN